MRTAAVALAALAVGCFGPQIQEGLSCATTGECPFGQFCDADDVCRFVAADGGGDGGGDGDGDGDGDAAVDDGFCDDPDIALCLRFEGRPDDDSSTMFDAVQIDQVDYVSDGITGGAASFTGAGHIEIGDRIGSGTMTIELWIRPTGKSGTIVGSNAFAIRELDDGRIQWASNVLTTLSAGPVDSGDWLHVAVVLGMSSLTSLYVAGDLEQQVPFAGLGGVPDLSIGSNFDDAPWSGGVDQLRVWNGALDDSQIAAIAQTN
jgi:hypothetical protein